MSTGYPWFKCRREPWHTLISKAEKPLPKIVALQDLEALESGKIPPTQAELCERWGWSRGRVRWLLDGLKEAEKPTTTQQPRNNHATTKKTKTPKTTSGSTKANNHATTTEQPPSDRPTNKDKRVRSKNNTSHNKTDFDRAVLLWKGHRPKGPKLKRDKGGGKLIAARIEDQGIDAVIDVLGWAISSSHSLAEWLRGQGYGLSTICRPTNFENYLEIAQNATPAKQRGEWTDYDDEPNKPPF